MRAMPITALYTVTFKYDGDFDLPDDEEICLREVPKMVTEKLEQNTFELVDFNLTAHYDSQNADNYVKDKYLHRSVLEIEIPLFAEDLESREAIYNRCLQAMKKKELVLTAATEHDNPLLGILQSIIKFKYEKQSG